MANEAFVLAVLLTLKDEASKAIEDVEKRFGKVGKAAVLAAGAAAGAMAGVGKVLWDAAQAAGEEEVGIAKLGAAVRATGADWDTARAKIEAYLAAQAKRTALDDGEARDALTQLVTITGDYERSLDLLGLAQDLAVAKGMDLSSAAQLVGRVAQGNTSILSRYGIVIGEGATAQEALAALQERFAGQAETYGQTFVGAQERMDIALGNLKETIGAAVLPVLTRLFSGLSAIAEQALPYVEQALTTVLGFISENQFVLIGLGVLVGTVLVAAFWAMAGAAISAAISTMSALAPIVLPILAIIGVMALLKEAWESDWGGIRTALTTVWEETLRPIFETLKQWFTETLPDALRRVWAAVQERWNGIRDTVMSAWGVLRDIFEKIRSWFTETLPGAAETLWRRVDGQWQAIKRSIGLVWDAVRGIFEAVQTWFTRTIPDAADTAFRGIRDAWDSIGTTTGRVWDGVQGAVRGAINSILSAINALIRAWNRLEFRIPGFSVEIPSITLPVIGTIGGGHLGWPGITISTPDLPEIPLLAQGAIVRRPTLALIGEAGPEAVIPLGRRGAAGVTYNLTYIDQRPNGGPPDILAIARRLEWQARLNRA